MASIRKNKSGRWEIRYRSPDGVQRTKGGFPSKADAKANAATIEHTVRLGEWRNPALSKITVALWVEEYFDAATHKRASTLARDHQIVRQYLLPALGTVPIAYVKPIDIHRIIDPLAATLQPSTIRGIYGVLATIFKTAVDAEVIVSTPCRGVRRPIERRKEKRLLTVQELDTLSGAMDPAYSVFVYLGGVMGLRFSEIAGLQIGDINFLRRTLTVVRTVAEVKGRTSIEDVKTPSSRRTLKVPKFVMAELSSHIARTGKSGRETFLLTIPNGGVVRYSNFHRDIWSPALAKSGINDASTLKLRIHGLRHTAAGLMIQLGTHPRVIQQRLGHSSIATTMNVYGQLLPGVEDGVTDALDGLLVPATESMVTSSEDAPIAAIDDLFSAASGADVVPISTSLSAS